MTKKKKDTIKSLAIHNKDVGSAEIQIGLLTDKITKLSEHFKKFLKFPMLEKSQGLKYWVEKLRVNLKLE